MKPILSPKCVSTTILSVDFDSTPKPTAILLERPVYEELQCVDCGDSVTLVSSQSFLLNTKRLENSIGYDSTKRLVDTALRNLQMARPSLASQLPDDFDFTQLVRDRNIQTPSELQAFVDYHQSIIDDYNKSAAVKKSWKTWFARRNASESKPKPKVDELKDE